MFSRLRKRHHSLLSFPYVCPEPVLVKLCMIYINGANAAFLYLILLTVNAAQLPRSHAQTVCITIGSSMRLFTNVRSEPSPATSTLEGTIIGALISCTPAARRHRLRRTPLFQRFLVFVPSLSG